MDVLNENKLFTTLYEGFFAKDDTTKTERFTFQRWTNILIRWLTTTESERRIVSKLSKDNHLLQRIKKHCKRRNEALYLTCLKTRKENLKKGKTNHARS